MRISKLYLVICAAALCALPSTIRADDNPAQAAARAALEEQMRELDTPQAPKNVPSSTPTAPAQPAQPAAAPAGATMQQPTNQSAATAPPMTPAPGVAPAQTAAPAASTAVHPGNSLFSPVPPPSGGIPAGTMLEEPASSSTTPTATTAVQTPAPVATSSPSMASSQNNDSANNPGKELGLKPVVAPPLPISADQQAQLRALLEKYEAGSITPVEYQVERKKILNLPH